MRKGGINERRCYKEQVYQIHNNWSFWARSTRNRYNDSGFEFGNSLVNCKN